MTVIRRVCGSFDRVVDLAFTGNGVVGGRGVPLLGFSSEIGFAIWARQ